MVGATTEEVRPVSQEFWNTLVRLLPFAVAGAMVPSWTKYVVILLGSKRPITNGLAFVLGNATFRLLFGIVALALFTVDRVDATIQDPPGNQDNLYLIVPAIALALLGIWLFRKKPKREDELPKWLKALEGIKPRLAFGAGFAMVALPGIQYVYFLGGIGVMHNSGMSWAQVLFVLVVFVAFLQLMLLSPVIVFRLGGERAERYMASFKVWLGKNEFKVFAVIFLGFAGFLFLKVFGIL
jgi:hypothetical protein